MWYRHGTTREYSNEIHETSGNCITSHTSNISCCATLTPTKVAATDTASPEFLEAVQSAMLEYIDATAMEGKHQYLML